MKRILALLLSLLMILTPTFSYAEEVTTETTPYEIRDEEKVLSSLEIIDIKDFDGRAPVTRAQFIVSVMKLCGLGELSPAKTTFKDIPEDADYSGAVKTATDAGIINGFEDNTFRPDMTITTEQAVKIVLSATGFDVYAASYGGYPGGYLTIATVNGLLKRVLVGEFTECTWADAAMILYNALAMDILQQVEYPQGSYNTIEGENPLTKWHNVSKTRGIVNANEYTSLTVSKGLSDGKVRIDDKQYNAENTNASDYLGYNVTVYHKEIDGVDTILLCIPESRAKIYEISSEDISPNTTTSLFEYYDGLSAVRHTITGAHFIYNGKASTLTTSKLLIADGNIKLLDREGNGTIDVIFAENYTTYYVDSVNNKLYSLVDKFTDAKILFDIDSPKSDIIIYDEGEEVDFSAIKAGHVLSVAKSEDGTYTKIMLGTEKVDAAIIEKSNDILTLDEGDGDYKLASNVKPLLSTLEINEVKTFTLTFDGKIGGWSDSKTSGKYGYLITAAAIGSGLSGTHQGTFRIFDPNSQKIQNFTTAEEIKFNGKFTDESGNKYSGRLIIEKLTDGGVIKDQLVKFVTNEDGLITELFTAKRNTAEPFNADSENFTLDYWLEYAGGKSASGYVEASNPKIQLGDNPCRNNYYFGLYTWHDNSYGTIDAYISCKNTTMIALPVIPEGKTLMDMEKDITVVTNNWFSGDSQRLRFLYLKVYDMNESRQAQILVFRNYAGGGSGTTPNHEHVLVEKIAQGIDDDGYDATKIYGYIGDEKVEYVVDSQAVFEGKISESDLNLKAGDIIRVATAPDVIRIVKIFSPAPDDGKGEYFMYSDGFEDWQMTSTSTEYAPVPKPSVVETAGLAGPNYEQMSIALHGRIRKATSGGFVVTQDANRGPTDIFAIIRSGDVEYSVYDEATGKVRAGSFNDIDPNNPKQTVVMNLSYSRAHEICIYNWKEEKYPVWKGAY